MWVADLQNGNYRNPVLYADYSDPDAIRVGEDYFMIASSFSNSPALPVLHSKDLVNWKVINYCLKHVPEFRYNNPIHGCGVWAPSIRYHEGTYYVCFPMPDEGIYMTTTKDPWGEWSKPVNIRPGAGWIDPCPFWDDDGKAYLVAGVAKSRIGYKSVLHIVRMQPDGMGIFGDEVKIFDGNENDQITIEGPKMYKRNGYYYVFAPAGGVKTGWQTVLRSKNPFGPYEYKVVLRQGDSPVNGPHQGAWVDTVTGEDWFLHFQDVYAAGRITHFQPMLQILSVMIIESMQCQHWKSKVINPKALIGNFHGNGVMFVDFRQDLYMFLFDNIFDLMQQFPDVRFNKKAVGVRFLYSIGKCIQSNDRCPVMTHGEQCIPDKFLCHISANIQIDLFLTECTPYFIAAAV